jgi:hypothetical protein
MEVDIKNVFHSIAEIIILNMRHANGLGMEIRNK